MSSDHPPTEHAPTNGTPTNRTRTEHAPKNRTRTDRPSTEHVSTNRTPAELTQQVVTRLENVLDPCSCMTETPRNIVELGLLEDVAVEGTTVEVELVPTSPMCLYMAQIIDEATAEIGTLDGVETVRVTQNVETLWRPERMADELQASRDERSRTIEGPSDAT